MLSPHICDEANSGGWGDTTRWHPQSTPAPKEGLFQSHFKDEKNQGAEKYKGTSSGSPTREQESHDFPSRPPDPQAKELATLSAH